MAETMFLAEKLLEQLEVLRQEVRQRPWRELSREAFVHQLRRAVEGFEGVAAQLEGLHAALREKPSPNQPDLHEPLKELNATLSLLKRNLKLEEGKPFISGHTKLSESRETPELYASIEDKLLTALAKTAFLGERLNLYGQRQADIGPGLRGAPKNVLTLLEHKEDELQALKQRYDDLRNKTFFGAIAEESTAELERELNDLNARLHAERALLTRDLEIFNREINELLDRQLEFDRKMQALNDLYADYARKSTELLSLVKREKDLSRKALLDTEQETAHLRMAYSKELLRMDEAKLLAHKAGRDEAQKELEKLRRELKDKEELLSHFRKMAEEKEQELSRAKEKKPR